MDDKNFSAICRQVYRQYPEVNGARPVVHPHGDEHTLLVFHGKAKTANGQTIPRIVRVVVSQKGKITKITTSR